MSGYDNENNDRPVGTENAQEIRTEAPRTYEPVPVPVTQPARNSGKKPSASVLIAVFLVTALLFSTVSGLAVWLATRPDAVPIGGSTTATTQNGEPAATTAEVTAGTFDIEDLSALPSYGNRKSMKTYEIAADVGPAVVAITTETVTSFYGRLTTSQSAGSGIIFTKDGYVVTNAHVVEGAKTITVVTEAGDSYKAKLIGEDSQSDIAVLKIESDKDLPYAVFGDSDELVRGEMAVAIGNPLGELAGTVTVGVISALNRQITIDNVTMNLIQTDAAINAGNSGGALVNSYGEVIGINSAKNSSEGVEGLGFAIPINDAKPVIEELINNGYVTGRPIIGISGESVPDQIAQRYGWPLGVYVGSVEPGSAAEIAGIREGDIIVEFDGTAVTSVAELNSVKESHKAGDSVSVKIYRTDDESEATLTLVLGEDKPTVTQTSTGSGGSNTGRI
ncbi:MAG: trypsin-like peptidase domain-containing protein [Clostridia bacterium]|nr:trypsin-like peptidase domain-containing protein [Clostridia bacterium]